EWDRSTPATDVVIADDIELRSSQGKRSRAFKRFRVALVAVGVLIEDTVSTANGRLAVALGIKGEADARCRVEEMPVQAARIGVGASTGVRETGNREGPSRAAALNDAVKGIARARDQRAGKPGQRAVGIINGGRIRRVEAVRNTTRIEIKGVAIAV